MNTTIEQQAKDIHYIIKLLSLDTKDCDDICSNIEYIKLLSSSLLRKCDIIEKEMCIH